MSWLDKTENTVFEIKTGDGKRYNPLWISGEKSIEYNHSKFDFINLEGSLVDRKKPKSNKYPLVFWFQGKNNIEQSEAFERSSKDPRYWEVIHPFYGVIYGQPLSLTRSDEHFNVTKISVDFWETIIEDYPKSGVSLRDNVVSKVSALNTIGAISFNSGVKPKHSDIPLIKENIVSSGKSLSILHQGDNYAKYKNKIEKALFASDNLVSNSNGLIKSVQELFKFTGESLSVTKRIEALKTTYLSLKSILKKKQNSKYYHETQGATIIGAIYETATTPLKDDYITREQVEIVCKQILELYNDYIETIDQNQVPQYDTENTWHPDSSLQIALFDLVVETTSGLSTLAFEAKQERIIEVDKNTNIYLLTHTYMGLDIEDKNIETFRKINGIGGNELFVIRKGRKIKYFV